MSLCDGHHLHLHHLSSLHHYLRLRLLWLHADGRYKGTECMRVCFRLHAHSLPTLGLNFYFEVADCWLATTFGICMKWHYDEMRVQNKKT